MDSGTNGRLSRPAVQQEVTGKRRGIPEAVETPHKGTPPESDTVYACIYTSAIRCTAHSTHNFLREYCGLASGHVTGVRCPISRAREEEWMLDTKGTAYDYSWLS